MIQVKSFVVSGATVTRNGLREKTLAKEMDVKLNDFLKTVPGEILDIKTNVEFNGNTDSALVTVLYREEEVKPSKAAK